MQIRKATMEDREGVIELLRTLLIPAGEVPESWRDEAQIFRLLVENPELGTILVALSVVLLIVAEWARRLGVRKRGGTDSGGFL